jgi:hypothetical protein
MNGRVGALLMSLASCGAGTFACGGGQSGSEGDPPAPPCAGDGLVLQGRITQLGAGCVSIAVDAATSGAQSVTSPAGALLLGANVSPGQVVRGRLGQVYSYAHDFALGDPVAALAGSWGDMLNLELLPRQDSTVRVQWAGRQFETSLSTLTSDECSAMMSAHRDDDSVRIEGGASDRVHQVEPAPAEPRCAE